MVSMSWPLWWDIDYLHCSSDRGSGYQSFFCCLINLKIVKHSQTLNQNIGIKIVKKKSKYSTHNNQFQIVVRLQFRYLRLNYPINTRGVKIDDVIINIYINTFGVELIENFNLISVVITTYIKKEIIVNME